MAKTRSESEDTNIYVSIDDLVTNAAMRMIVQHFEDEKKEQPSHKNELNEFKKAYMASVMSPEK